MKYLCKIHDIGKNWKITELMEVEDAFYVDATRYLRVEKENFEKLKDLSKSNELYYPKSEEAFSIEKIVVEEMDPLFLTKYKIKNTLTASFKQSFSNGDLFSFLKFVSLSSELSDKGHYLHIGNLDQKIEEIGKLNNHKLLEKAEDLSAIIKEIEPHISSFDKLLRIKKDIDKCSNKEQIKELIAKY